MSKRGSSGDYSKKRIRRSVHGHDWRSLEEWVRTLDELSTLDDDEIDDLVRMTANDTRPIKDRD